METTSEAGRRGVPAADTTATVHVRVLGDLRLEHEGRVLHVAGTHRRRLLALLASRVGQSVGIDASVDALWGEDPPPTASKTIQSHVARLRASLTPVGRELIETTPGGYRLVSDSVVVDAAEFERLAAEGHHLLAARDVTAAAAVLSDALGLWTGVPYADVPEAEFAAHERTRLEQIHALAVEDAVDARLESGGASAVIPTLERLVAGDPGRERAWALLMRALYASGQQQDALVAFQRARHALADEFGLEPGPALRDLEARVLAHDPDLTIARRAELPAGLRGPQTDLMGRTMEQAWLTGAWEAARRGRGRTCVLLGGHGSGRTQLARWLAARAAADQAAIFYGRGAEALASMPGRDGDPVSAAAIVDRVIDRSRRQPVLLVLDDVEWAPAVAMEMASALSAALDDAAVLALLVGDPAASGPALQALRRLDPSGGRTMTLGPLSDDDIAAIVSADGLDDDAAASAIVSMAAGMPGVARREASAWAERIAGDRVQFAAASSVNALAVADGARESMVDEVARLVLARARRHRLGSEAWLGRQPYRGLESYGPADADVFVGRERSIAELATRVLERRVVIVTGSSGSGKSSLVRAGLVPLVRSGRLPGEAAWRTNVVVPGRDPVRTLDSIEDLDEPGTQLLVIDQFEEAFAHGADALDRFVARVIDLALDPAIDVHIVLVVRGDQYVHLAEARHLSELADDALVVVGRPGDAELRRMVEEPAVRAGCRVEPALVSAVLTDVGTADGALPLVSTAMAELWEQRTDETLTLEHYVASGGLSASVERLGDRVLDHFDDEDAVRRASLFLADVTDDGSWIRRRVVRDDVPTDLRAAVAALVDGRLAVQDDESVELTHEVVFRAWPRLREWLDDARTDLVLGHDVRNGARAWDEGGRNDDDVFRGARLAAAVEWGQRKPDSVTPVVAAFLSAGVAVADHARVAAEEQLAAERRSAKRLRRSLVAASLLLVVAIVGGSLAVVARDRAANDRDAAERERATAAEQRDLADAARQEADAERDNAQIARLIAASEGSAARPDVALLLAVEAARRSDSPAAQGAMLTALTRPGAPADTQQRSEAKLPSSFDGFINTGLPAPMRIVISDDGSTIAVSTDESHTTGNVFASFDVDTRSLLQRTDLPEAFGIARLSPDGAWALVFNDHVVDRMSTADGARQSLIQADDDHIVSASLSTDAELFTVGWIDGSVTVHDASTGSQIDAGDLPRVYNGLASFVDDTTLALGLVRDGAAGVEFWDVRLGGSERLVWLEPVMFPDRAEFTFNPDMTRLVMTFPSSQPGMAVWDLSDGHLVGDLQDRPSGLRGPAAFVTADVIALGHFDGSLTFYDIATDEVVERRPQAHAGGVWGVAATPDHSVMVSTADDGVVAVWGVSDRGLLDDLVVTGYGPSLSDDASRLAYIIGAGEMHLLSVDRPVPTEEPVRMPVAQQAVRWHRVNGDGSRALLVVLPGDRLQYVVVDLDEGRQVWRMPPDVERSSVTSVELSADGNTVYAVWADGDRLTAFGVDSGAAASIDKSVLGPDDFPEWMNRSWDGKYLDLGMPNEIVRLDGDTLEVVARVPVDGQLQGNLVSVPGTDQVIGVGRGGWIVKADMSTGEVTSGQSRDSSTLGGLAISPDGTTIGALHPFDRTVALFDTATLQPIGLPIPVFATENSRPGFLNDGSLLTETQWGLSRWNMDPATWEALACHAAGRNLTLEEWRELFGDEPYRATCPEWPAGT